jgi:hypothetical protein
MIYSLIGRYANKWKAEVHLAIDLKFVWRSPDQVVLPTFELQSVGESSGSNFVNKKFAGNLSNNEDALLTKSCLAR